MLDSHELAEIGAFNGVVLLFTNWRNGVPVVGDYMVF